MTSPDCLHQWVEVAELTACYLVVVAAVVVFVIVYWLYLGGARAAAVTAQIHMYIFCRTKKRRGA